jgi:hypothetical protein
MNLNRMCALINNSIIILRKHGHDFSSKSTVIGFDQKATDIGLFSQKSTQIFHSQ